VPESKATRSEDRNKEDIAFCLRLFNNCLQVGLTDEDLISVFRLGKHNEDEDTPRPLLAQLASYTQTNLIMESLYKLKHAEAQFRRVIIAHDMTKIEREDCRKLVADAKWMEERDTSGEYLYRVRGLPGKMN